VKLLLDTHVVLWFLAGDPILSRPARSAIESAANERLVSTASLWEIAIEAKHLAAVTRLPLHHRDPFDRLLIAQALVEGLTVVTHDRSFHEYEIAVIS
jgi:PIN domain nuclease of toxin-antitoxin system